MAEAVSEIIVSTISGEENDLLDIKILDDFSQANLDEMVEIYQSVGWNNHTKAIITQVFQAM
ncbi:hypothetical protein BpJC7_15290 [Weizmannia acidilactici]|uniref:Uncharacterized protein n=1 Tax=Weizmannia acidilactici TaxID=2607726 RepID=A0A5J4J5L0_9BACI|nr:hypothetical protein BpJC4_10240 [Weizmannia acidilactici]GER70226.1 hypothetical protein BpJC7_15290 [Weizmannia acidilactici]GER74573.1 hypothetical protein BpPP18_26400 [Weizmannia acidilactici]